MTKPAPYRLLAKSYPFRTLLQTRYADLDVNVHINNVAIATLFEEGRVRLLSEGRADPGLRQFAAVVVSANFTYLREGVYGVDVEMACGIAKIGTSSWTIHGAAFQNGVAIATCDSVGVYVKDGAAAPMSDAWRARLNTYLIHAPA